MSKPVHIQISRGTKTLVDRKKIIDELLDLMRVRLKTKNKVDDVVFKSVHNQISRHIREIEYE